MYSTGLVICGFVWYVTFTHFILALSRPLCTVGCSQSIELWHNLPCDLFGINKNYFETCIHLPLKFSTFAALIFPQNKKSKVETFFENLLNKYSPALSLEIFTKPNSMCTYTLNGLFGPSCQCSKNCM